MSASTSRPDFTAAMNRLREIALTSADNALTEGPVNADRQLLDLCAETLHVLVHPERHYAARRATKDYLGSWQEFNGDVKSAKPRMHRIRKMKATTAAGIYAKAAVVRASKTGAADLAMSLAEDLLAAPGLRAALWPAEGAE